MTASAYPAVTSHMPKNSYRPTKKTNKLVIFSILRHNLSKKFTQTGLYCSKQLETTFNQVGKKSLHIIFKLQARCEPYMREFEIISMIYNVFDVFFV